MNEKGRVRGEKAKRDPSYVYFEELRIFLPFLAINFGSDFFIQFYSISFIERARRLLEIHALCKVRKNSEDRAKRDPSYIRLFGRNTNIFQFLEISIFFCFIYFK